MYQMSQTNQNFPKIQEILGIQFGRRIQSFLKILMLQYFQRIQKIQWILTILYYLMFQSIQKFQKNQQLLIDPMNQKNRYSLMIQ